MRLLTLHDVAGELGCSLKTVKRRVRAGLLPTFVDGRIVRVREDDFRRYVAERVTRRVSTEAGGPAPLSTHGIMLRPGERLTDSAPCRRPESVT